MAPSTMPLRKALELMEKGDIEQGKDGMVVLDGRVSHCYKSGQALTLHATGLVVPYDALANLPTRISALVEENSELNDRESD